MGKSKKGRQGYSEKQSLADQIIDGRVVKGKTRNKIRLRHDEDELVSDYTAFFMLFVINTKFFLIFR